MRDVSNEDFDSFFLRVTRILGTEEEVFQGEDTDFELGFSIGIPHGFFRLKNEEAKDIFWSKNRPPVLFASDGRNEVHSLIFLQCGHETEEGICLSLQE